MVNSSHTKPPSLSNLITIQFTIFIGVRVKRELNSFQHLQMAGSFGGILRCLIMVQLKNSYLKNTLISMDKKSIRFLAEPVSSIMLNIVPSSSLSEPSKVLLFRQVEDRKRLKLLITSVSKQANITVQSMLVSEIQQI